MAFRFVLGALVCALFAACEDRDEAGLTRALTGRGKVAVLGAADLRALPADASTLLDAAQLGEVNARLSARDGYALSRALAAAGCRGIVVDARPSSVSLASGSVAERMARYARVEGFSGAYLSPRAAFYTLDPLREWSPALRSGVAEVARRLLAGAASPRLTSFPEALRRVEPVEVMVLLRSGKTPRLWRSARGSSFARALVTAASVARKRWLEREQAMGGPIDQALPRLTVEVAMLEDDGELGSRDRGFVDRVIGPEHGIAYEHKGAWRYLLPEATHTPKSARPSEAYARLLSEDGLPEELFESTELRPYRIAVRVLGASEGAPVPEPVKPRDALSDVGSPAEVLGDSK